MKQPKRLTYNQKRLLSSKGFDPDKYMFQKEKDGRLLLWNKEAQKSEWFPDSPNDSEKAVK